MLIQTLRYLKCVSQQKVSQLSTSFIWQWHLIRTTLICRFTYLRSGLHGLFVFGENRNKRWKKQTCLTLSCAARADPFPLQHDGEKFVLDGCQDGETRWSEWFSLSHVSVNTFVRLWCFTAAIFTSKGDAAVCEVFLITCAAISRLIFQLSIVLLICL